MINQNEGKSAAQQNNEHYIDPAKYMQYGCSPINESVKPPIGVAPRFIIDEQRQCDLTAAIIRYVSAGINVSPEWVAEYNEIVARIRR